jgi:filamentous hemagglutinin family protein
MKSSDKQQTCHILNLSGGRLLIAVLPGKKPGSLLKRLIHRALSFIPAAILALFPSLLFASPVNTTQLPTGGLVVAGQAVIQQQNAQMNITQSSRNAILNWGSFNIGAQASVNFNQPDATSVALNRVISADPSAIYGSLSANGQVFLINQSGILFGQGVSVNVGGLVASTLNISNSDFLSGNYRFTRDGGMGSIVNQGNISAANGGYVTLLATDVSNRGNITASMGTIALAAGDAVTLDISGRNLLSVTVDPATVQTLIENKQLLQAGGGQVILTTHAADELLGSVIKNDGSIEANSMQNVNGKIVIEGGAVTNDGQIVTEGGKVSVTGTAINNSGTINTNSLVSQGGSVLLKGTTSVEAGGTISAQGVSGGTISVLSDMTSGIVTVTGKLDASASEIPSMLPSPAGRGVRGEGANGGFIETSAAHVTVADGAKITTAASNGLYGTWLIDPSDFTIAATGGDITGAALSTNLAGGSIIIQSSSGATGTSGNVNVNDVVSWSANQLTLNAQNNININASLNGSGTASLALLYGQGAVAAGNTSRYILAPNIQVNLPAGQNFSTLLGSNGTAVNYAVISNLGLAGSTTTTDLQGINGGLSGNYVLGGNIDATATSTWNSGAGFTPIGNASGQFTGTLDGLGHTISNLTINMPTASNVGLFGNTGFGSIISNVGLTSGSVTGNSFVGGLVGQNFMGTISNSYATGSVSGSGYVGGLVGENYSGTISNSYATGNITGTGSEVGGLVGYNNGILSNSFYNIDAVTINSGHQLTQGGLYNAQYTDWFTHNETLNISNYASTLPSLGGGYYGVNSIQSLNNMLGFSESHANFRLTSNLDLTANSGFYIPYFAGNFDGGNNTISNLSVNANNSEIGMFGYLPSGSISNLGLVNAIVSGNIDVGGLVGYSMGTISNNYATGSVSGAMGIGGLLGLNKGTISNSYAMVKITGTGSVGGLVGDNWAGISNSYATGSVTGTGNFIGGLAGFNNYGTINNGYWNTSNNVTGMVGIGGGMILTGATGLTTAQMQIASNFTGFTFTTTPGASGWVIVNADGTLNSGTGGGTFPMLASEYSTTISNTHQLQLMEMALGANYTLNANINASATGDSTDVWDASGFVPIGNATTPFTSTFDGLGHTISGLLINRPASNEIGLFGDTGFGSFLSNIGLLGGSVMGSYVVGTLAGSNLGTISNSYAIGSVSGSSHVGGLSGSNSGTVSNSYAKGFVTGTGYWVGGLVGLNQRVISNSYATASVTGTTEVGGLAGESSDTISNSYATGSVSGSDRVGGLTGANYGTISNSYATDSVRGNSSLGGLAGLNVSTISNSYSTGSVNGNTNIGGLVGQNYIGTISSSYATGSVNSTGLNVGALAGNNSSSIINSFYNSDINSTGIGTGSSAGVTGLTTAQMMQLSSFTGWDIANTGGAGKVWRIYEGHTSPLLTSFLTPLTLNSVPDITTTYNGAVQSGAIITLPNGVSGVAATGTNAGFYNGYYSTQQGYDITGGNLLITPLAVILAGNKVYDGTATFTTGQLGIIDIVSGDVLGLSTGSANTSSKNAGAGSITSFNGLVLSGSSASNYTLTGVSGSGKITPLVLTGSITTGSSTYGSTLLPGVASFTNAIPGDNLGVAQVVVNITGNTSTSGNLNAGNYTGIESLSSLSGPDAGNYTFARVTGNYTVLPGIVSITGITAANKVYDGMTTASLYGTGVLSGVFSGDTVNLLGTLSGAFADKKVGTNKVVSLSGGSITGLDAGNYILTNPAGLTANITPASLTLTGLAANNKVYDATTAATLSGTGVLSGVLLTDTVNLSGTLSGVFADKNVANGKVVTVSGSIITGKDAGNYTLTAPAGLTANITPTSLSVNAVSASKVYDGGTNSSGTVLISGLVGSDTLTGATQSYASKNVLGANQSTLAVNSGYTLSDGNAGGNYAVTLNTATGTITPASLTVTGFTASNKIYDATTAATLNGAGGLSGVLSGDMVNLIGTISGAFSDKNVGTNKVVSLSGGSITGLDAGNYILTNPAGLTANITSASLTVTGLTANNKVYDATTAATLSDTGVLSGVLLTDSVSLSGPPSGVFADKNVGNGKIVTVSGLSITGLDAGNYILTNPAGLTANITPTSLSVNAVSASKVYDGGTSSSGTVSIKGLVGSDTLTGATQSYASKNVLGANQSTLAVNSGYMLSDGNAGGNYAVTLNTATGTITPASLTVTGLTASNKVYDGATTATLNLATPGFAGMIAGDNLNVSAASGAFSDMNVGIGKTVNISGITLGGTDAGNYVILPNTATTTAGITQLASVAWTGVAQSNWSDASNWAGGAIPTGANVAAVSIPSGSSVIYDTGASNTVLSTLSSAGNLVLNGNNLSIGNFIQNSGNLSGIGKLNVSNSFSQSGGATIALSGAANITQSTGNLTIANFGASAVNLNAGNGAITQTGSITAGTLNTQSVTGATLNDAGNKIGTFSATNTGSGNITLNNTTPLTITGISNAGGNVTVNNTGELSIAGMIAAGAVNLTGGAINEVGTGLINSTGLLTTNSVGGVTLNGANTVNSFSASNTGGGIQLNNAAETLVLTGISQTAGDDITVVNAGNISNAGIINTTGNVTLTGGIIMESGAGAVTNSALLTVSSNGGLTLNGDNTIAGFIANNLSAGDVSLTNTGILDIVQISTPGLINVSNNGAVTVGSLVTPGSRMSVTAGKAITITAHSPLTINGQINAHDDIALSAGATIGGTTDILTINSPVVSLAGKVSLKAGNSIVGASWVSAALGVTQQANLNNRNVESTTQALPDSVISSVTQTTNNTTAALTNTSTNANTLATASLPQQTIGMTGSESIALLASDTSILATNPDSRKTSDTTAPGTDATNDQQVSTTSVDTRALSDKSATTKSAATLALLAAEESARHQARTDLYKEALQALKEDQTAADLPLCGKKEDKNALCIPESFKLPEDLPSRISAEEAATSTGPYKSIQPKRKIAIMIGNDTYSGNIPSLHTPVHDVETIGAVLKDKMGYEVNVVLNATKKDVFVALKSVAEKLTTNDSVLIFYAGHGYQMEDTGQGFWIPSDASTKDPKTWISNSDIAKMLRVIPAKQIILVSDSCFSGTLTQEQQIFASGVSEKDLVLTKRSVVAFSSGGEEPVSDNGKEGHSIFAYYFLKELQGTKGLTSSKRMHALVQAEVMKDFPQDPQLGGVVSAGHTTGGDYLIFEINKPK